MTWKELIQILASGRHHYSPECLENSPLGLKRYAAIARDVRLSDSRHAKRMGRFRFADATSTAILFRMGVGQPGDVNRLHPVDIEPCLIDVNAPPTAYGQAVVGDATTQGVRPLAAGDLTASAFDVYGITVRPAVGQQQSGGMSSALGAATPPVTGVIDVMKKGYMKIQFNLSGSAPAKFGQAYVWAAATSGAHIQAGWETAAGTPGTNTVLISAPPRTVYQGGWDASDVGEIAFHQ